MEGNGYGSAHLPSPALVVFSQAAGGLGEALRIQRPFHSQIQDAKDLHHLSLVGSYGAHLLHGFPPHFLHPAVTSANSATSPFSGGGAFVKPFPSNLPLPSAFAPPPKCVGLGLEQSMLFSGNESFRTDSSSPACTSLSPPVKEESLEGHTSEEGDRDRICSPERSPDVPGFRPPKTNGAEPLNLRMDSTAHSLYRFPFYNSFKNFHQHQPGIGMKKPNLGTPPPNSCPVCGIQLSSNELETHFLAELDRLYKLSSGPERQRIRTSFNLNPAMHPNNGMMQGPDSRWETFQRIRTNRQGRLRAKTRKRKGDSESEFGDSIRSNTCHSCPVCHGRLQRTPEEIAQHVEECLKKNGQSRTEDEDETVDVESYGDETSNCAVNLASQQNINNNNNNNNNTKLDPNMRQASPRSLSSTEEQIITSGSNLWQHPKHRLGNNPASITALLAPTPINCTTTLLGPTNVSRATPTSSDQVSDYEHPNKDTCMIRGVTQLPRNANICETDNDEEVIIDNAENDDCGKKMVSRMDLKREDKNSTEEATSSMEIDSATDVPSHKSNVPTADSYVSTSEATEATSRAQVLEELRARIRELEGSPFKVRSSQDEEHFKCYICKDSKISCPQCKLVTSSNELRKIHV